VSSQELGCLLATGKGREGARPRETMGRKVGEGSSGQEETSGVWRRQGRLEKRQQVEWLLKSIYLLALYSFPRHLERAAQGESLCAARALSLLQTQGSTHHHPFACRPEPVDLHSPRVVLVPRGHWAHVKAPRA